MKKTPSVQLRELDRSDLPLINRWRNQADTVALLGGSFRHVCMAVDERWYEAYLGARANNVRLAIELKDAGVVGAVYLLGIDWIARSAEFAIWIGEPSAQGQGVGETATRRILAHAFGDLNLNRIHLTVLDSNAVAIALYEKLGFEREGVLRSAVWKQGAYRDLVQMAVLRDRPVAREAAQQGVAR